jgi:hypothetical protein
MMMRTSAQVSLVPPQTSHASKLTQQCEMAARKPRREQGSHSIASRHPVTPRARRGVATADAAFINNGFAVGYACDVVMISARKTRGGTRPTHQNNQRTQYCRHRILQVRMSRNEEATSAPPQKSKFQCINKQSP